MASVLRELGLPGSTTEFQIRLTPQEYEELLVCGAHAPTGTCILADIGNLRASALTRSFHFISPFRVGGLSSHFSGFPFIALLCLFVDGGVTHATYPRQGRRNIRHPRLQRSAALPGARAARPAPRRRAARGALPARGHNCPQSPDVAQRRWNPRLPARSHLTRNRVPHGRRTTWNRPISLWKNANCHNRHDCA